MKEKPREKKSKSKTESKPKEEEKETPKVLEKEKVVHRPEVVIIEPEIEKEIVTELVVTEAGDVEVIDEMIETIEPMEIYPQWGDITESEWMYSIPSRDDDKAMWAEEWGDFLLEWAQANTTHVFSLTVFLKEFPFKDITGKVDAFRLIGQNLVEKEVADWLDRGRRQLRVYWKPLEDWADEVYQWALSTGTTLLDLKTIVIQEADEDFAKLPERDIGILLSLIVDKGLASWVDKKKHAIKIEI